MKINTVKLCYLMVIYLVISDNSRSPYGPQLMEVIFLKRKL